MSCSSCNDCGGYVDNCVENNDCYQNCGCLVETTTNCVTQKEALPNIGSAENEKENVVLSKIDTIIGQLKGGKVAINVDDTCPEFLIDKLEAGANVSFSIVGTGCDAKIRIDSTTGGVVPDTSVRVSVNDTTSGFLSNKLTFGKHITPTLINAGANEQYKIDVVPSTLISADSGNLLILGQDGKIKTSYTAPTGAETKIVKGTGVVVSGSGTSADPYVISTNASIQAKRDCFDGVWKDATIPTLNNPNVTYVSGSIQYRLRFDGSIEFRGSVTYNVAFGNYSSTSRAINITVANIPVTCITADEQAGVVDMKSINYIDAPQTSSDQITQMYGYILRKDAQNLKIVFQSAFTNNTTKSVVVNFDGAISHPNI